jgi:hypothetical protein
VGGAWGGGVGGSEAFFGWFCGVAEALGVERTFGWLSGVGRLGGDYELRVPDYQAAPLCVSRA